MADWVTISALATAGGTLALAATTYASVRSANRASRVAELALLADLRPLLVESSENDPTQHVNFIEVTALPVPGGGAYVGRVDGSIFVVLSLKNVGPGIAVLHGGRVYGTQVTSRPDHSPVEAMRMLQRDLYIASGDVGYYQIAFRTGDADMPEGIEDAIAAGTISVEVLYGDYEGGQRMISRYAIRLIDGNWQVSTIRHWQLDREEVRPRD
jgi:hypothetical protein